MLQVVLKQADSLLVPRAQLAQHQRPAELGAEAGVEAGVQQCAEADLEAARGCHPQQQQQQFGAAAVRKEQQVGDGGQQTEN